MAQNPTSSNVSLIEITPALGCRRFPSELPNLNFVVVLVGGQPGRIYTTKMKLSIGGGPNTLVREVNGPDVPFTSQIKRANIAFGLLHFGKDKDLVKGPGTLRCELWIEGEMIAHADLEIEAVSE